MLINSKLVKNGEGVDRLHAAVQIVSLNGQLLKKEKILAEFRVFTFCFILVSKKGIFFF